MPEGEGVDTEVHLSNMRLTRPNAGIERFQMSDFDCVHCMSSVHSNALSKPISGINNIDKVKD